MCGALEPKSFALPTFVNSFVTLNLPKADLEAARIQVEEANNKTNIADDSMFDDNVSDDHKKI